MIFTKDEIQERINRSSDTDIQELIEDNFHIYLLKTLSSGEYSFNKKFVQKFFYDNISKLFADSIDSAQIGYSVSRELAQLLVNMGNKLDYSESDWGNHIDATGNLYKSNEYSKELMEDAIMHLISPANKTNYLSYLLNNKDKIIQIFSSYPSKVYSLTTIEKKAIMQLPADKRAEAHSVLVELGQKVSSFFSPGYDEADTVHELFTEHKDIANFLQVGGYFFSDAYKNKTLNEVINFVEYLIDIEMKPGYKSILYWFRDNPDKPITDDLAEKIISKWDGPLQLRHALSKDILLKYYPNASVRYLITNPRISIDDIDALGKRKQSLFEMRFFTEEEILKHPEYFDPADLKYSALGYISKDTFRVLNKTWGKRQRYNDKLVNFTLIVAYNISQNTLSLDNLKYLVEKTNASNKEILSVLSNHKLSGISNFSSASAFETILKIMSKK